MQVGPVKRYNGFAWILGKRASRTNFAVTPHHRSRSFVWVCIRIPLTLYQNLRSLMPMDAKFLPRGRWRSAAARFAVREKSSVVVKEMSSGRMDHFTSKIMLGPACAPAKEVLASSLPVYNAREMHIRTHPTCFSLGLSLLVTTQHAGNRSAQQGDIQTANRTRNKILKAAFRCYLRLASWFPHGPLRPSAAALRIRVLDGSLLAAVIAPFTSQPP